MTEVLPTEAEETMWVDSQVADADGCEKTSCMATGDVLKWVVAKEFN